MSTPKLTAAQLTILFASQQRQTTTMDVTPKLAAEWLESRNDRNRSISPEHVAMLARAMASKTFRLTHQGIAFNQEGKLIDGQHRLSAVVKSGCTVKMMVTFGADSKDMIVCDRSRNRTTRDALAIQNERDHAALRAAVLRMLLKVENGGNYKADDQEILREDIRHDGGLSWFAKSAHHKLWYAPFAAAIVYAYERRPQEITTFVEMVTAGANLPGRSAALVAYNAMVSRDIHLKGGSEARMIAFRKMLRACAAHCASEKISKLQDGEEGLRYFAKFPAAV